jgi:spermidine/putrescine transport system substrate-binding protein
MTDIDQRMDLADAALLRGLTEERLSRAKLLRRAGVGAAALGLTGFLSACGVGGSSGGATTAGGAAASESVGSAAWWAKQKQAGVLDFANWPLYIDTDHGKHPSLNQFTKQTGIKVAYKEVIQDNAPFYAKIRPSLQAGQGTGYDIVVMTNGWYLTELIDHKWLIPLDLSQLPNFTKYASPIVQSPAYDKGNTYTVAWQSGFTGIAYNPKLTGREITSIKDLWDPAFKGHVGMMSDNTELGAAGMLYLGIDQVTSTEADWHAAAKVLQQQRDKGLVRQYYDQSYIKALENGDTWITQAWSGDIFQANASGYPHLKFVVPKEGVMHWTDNMAIPLYAKHPVDALAWMNFYYQPKIAAEVADWVNYLCPVPAAKPVIAKQLDDPAVANSPLVFPTKAMDAKARDYYTFKDYAEFNTWNGIFDPIIQS